MFQHHTVPELMHAVATEGGVLPAAPKVSIDRLTATAIWQGVETRARFRNVERLDHGEVVSRSTGSKSPVYGANRNTFHCLGKTVAGRRLS
jgi:hypothetical protein